MILLNLFCKEIYLFQISILSEGLWREECMGLIEEKIIMEDKMEKVRLGIIGCGDMGLHHAQRLIKIKEVEIIAASDINSDSLKRFTNEFQVKHSFSDYNRILGIKEMDGVLISLPTFLHRAAVISAAKRGKHIFCEKPIAMTLKDADEMIKVCQENEVKFMLGFVRRFDNFWRKARQVIKEDLLGRPVIWHDVNSSLGAAYDWYFDKKKGGGPLIDGAVHNYDFGHYTFGKVKKVYASTINFKRNISAIDTGSAIIEYESKDKQVISWSWGLPKGAFGAQLTDVIGPKGALLFPGCFDEKEIPQSINQEKDGLFLLSLKEGGKEWIKWEKNDMFFDELLHFIDCIRKDREPYVTGKDGKKALEVGLAILKSGELGSAVEIES